MGAFLLITKIRKKIRISILFSQYLSTIYHHFFKILNIIYLVALFLQNIDNVFLPFLLSVVYVYLASIILELDHTLTIR